MLLVSESTLTTTAFHTTTSVPPTTLSSNQNTIPTLIPAQNCGTGIQTANTTNPACAINATNFTTQLLTSCCNGADRVLYNGNCNLYCEARNQTLQELDECMVAGYQRQNITNYLIVCNRIGASCSSTLALETATETANAAAGVLVRSWRRDGDVTKGAWAAFGVAIGILVGGMMMA